MRKIRNAYKIMAQKREGSDLLEEKGVDGRIVL
jgi:hypothetical protein